MHPASTPPVIVARGLGKSYRLYDQRWHRLAEIATRRRLHREHVALQGLDFELRRGESLGIIGENGAGKSTLLKMLAGVTQPSAGELEIDGTVASLLELGMGFHPEFTGRQNIQLNAAMLGLDEAETRRRVPEIVAFSELGHFIDRPVKTYSTGMAMRLGFAIAVQVEPDVLIIDEALSVGDGYFQKKCMNRLLQFRASGRTLLFCSHAMYYVDCFCERAIWLRDGRVAAHGPSGEVIRAYESFLATKSESLGEQNHPAESRSGPARLEGVRFPGQVEGSPPHFRCGEPWELEIEWQCDDPDLPIHLAVGINDAGDREICSFATLLAGLPPLRGGGRQRTRLVIPALPLLKGDFSLYVFLLDEEGLHVYDQKILPAAFSVASHGYRFGVVEVAHRWETSVPASPPARLAGTAVGSAADRTV